MSDHDDESGGFLGRWARLKRETRKTEIRPAEPTPEEQAAPAPVEEPEVDLESLPPLETLGPGSDFTPFLKKGVPLVLRNAALRRAWTSDPVIANFREVADYDWDFNAPGYGQLLPTDDVKKLLDRLLGGSDPEPKPQPQDPAEQIQVAEAQGDESTTESNVQNAPDLPPPDDHLRLPSEEPAPVLTQSISENQKVVEIGGENSEYKNAEGVILLKTEPEAPQRRRRHGGAAPR